MRVLLADDQVWLRSALRIMLEGEPRIQVVGETGCLALLPELVARLHPDLLFLDWQLTGLNTNDARLSTINHVRATRPNLYIIALTDDAMDSGILQLGANAHINRAEPPDNLMTTVQLAMARRAMERQPWQNDYHQH